MTRAFTLVELLVVVAIIVVLLALLTPVMDQAIYQAELAVCAGRVKAIAGAAPLYAASSARHYPYRGVTDSDGNNTCTKIYAGVFYETPPIDDRPVLRTMFPINTMLQCPLIASVQPVDLENSTSVSQIYASYSMYFGVRYPGHKGMRRLGDRWTWTDGTYGPAPVTWSMNLIAGDHDIVYREPVAAGSQLAQGGHPDADQKMQVVVQQDSVNTFSAWRMSRGYKRGTIDVNHATDDGAVIRYNHVTYDDDRMAKVPWDSNRFAGGHLMQVPKP